MTFRKQIVVLASGLALAAALGLIPREAGSQTAPHSAPVAPPTCVAACPADTATDA